MARETARIVSIAHLLAGRYVTREGWEPNFVETAVGNISRTNILASVVAVEDPKSVIIDDGTGRMQCRAFEKDIACKVGDVVLCIGRPRQFAGSLFLVPEIMKAVTDPAWIEYRKALLRQEAPPPASEEMLAQEAATGERQRTASVVEVESTASNDAAAAELEGARPVIASGKPIESLLDIIIRLDAGDGADIDAVIAAAGGDAEAKVTRLIEEGHVFTCKPGRVKVL
jgi:hypothetical protein